MKNNSSVFADSKKSKFFSEKLRKTLKSEDAKDLYVLASIIAFQELPFIQEYLKKIHDKSRSNPISKWMDQGSDIHGSYHRLYHGHDLPANIGSFVKRFGINSIPKFLYELIKDCSTPHGLPLPGVQYLAQSNVLKNTLLTKIFSIDITDTTAGSIALYDSYRYFKKYQKGFRQKDLNKGFFRVGFKISYGIWRGNPLLIAGGIADSAILILWYQNTGKQINNAQKQIEKEKNNLNQQYNKNFKECKQIKNTISQLQADLKHDQTQNKETDKIFKKAMANEEQYCSVQKPKLRIMRRRKRQ